ncbi:MAG: hypothetical protein M0Z75_09725 [Nitrospiraceae bacterium]|nr:hypothetical protein [Nitrospiraceae bacterium]
MPNINSTVDANNDAGQINGWSKWLASFVKQSAGNREHWQGEDVLGKSLPAVRLRKGTLN